MIPPTPSINRVPSFFATASRQKPTSSSKTISRPSRAAAMSGESAAANCQGDTRFKVRAYEVKGIFSSGFADRGKADRRIENLPCQSGLAALFKIRLRQQHRPIWGNRDHELAVILHRRHRCRPSQAVRQRESRAQPPGVLRIQGRLIVLDRVLEICAWG